LSKSNFSWASNFSPLHPTLLGRCGERRVSVLAAAVTAGGGREKSLVEQKNFMLGRNTAFAITLTIE
jgi:hypothetical protein